MQQHSPLIVRCHLASSGVWDTPRTDVLFDWPRRRKELDCGVDPTFRSALLALVRKTSGPVTHGIFEVMKFDKRLGSRSPLTMEDTGRQICPLGCLTRLLYYSTVVPSLVKAYWMPLTTCLTL